jgi:hypothetical protein
METRSGSLAALRAVAARAGSRDLARTPGSDRARQLEWLGLAVLTTSAIGALLLAAALLGPGTRLIETPIPTAGWAVDLAGGPSPPHLEQAQQVDALRRVAGGTAALVALLSLLIALGLWAQRHRLRRAESYVHWSVGARPVQLMARLVGEGWPWALATALAVAAVVAVVPVVIVRTFPGDARVPPGLAVALLAATAWTVAVLGWEGGSGKRAARRESTPLARLSGPVAVAALGFAVLTGVGLLTAHSPARVADDDPRRIARVSFAAFADQERAEQISGWVDRVVGGGAGLAGAGAARGAGIRALVWAECAECYGGLEYVPFRNVQAEVFAVAPDTFSLLGLRVTAGRDFDAALDAESGAVAIVSQAMARRSFADGAALGRKIRFGTSDWMTVIGIVTDRIDVRDQFEYAVYLPVAQAAPEELELIASDPRAAAGALARAPGGARVGPLRRLGAVFAVHRWFETVTRGLGMLAYALVAFGVWLGARSETRTTAFEIALRRALGARRGDLTRLFLSTTAARLAIALTLGAWLSLFLGAGLQQAYAAIPRLDPAVWLRAALAVGIALLVGSWPTFAAARRVPPAEGMERSW